MCGPWPCLLGEHLGADRAQYWEAEPDGEHFRSEGGYAKDMPPISGRIHANDFGAHVPEEMGAGQTLVIADAVADPRLSETELAPYGAFGFRACIGVPLVEGGRLVAARGIYRAGPHEWTKGEIALAEEMAERTWAAVERARAEVALREREAELARGAANRSGGRHGDRPP
jgi:GAF domain-containing protein